MIKDPKQIVTPFAFSVHPELLGQPLATPKRRLFAVIIDVFIAYLLAGLGNLVLASAATFLIFWTLIRIRSKSTFKNLLRFTAATFASFFIFALALGFLEVFDLSENEVELDSSIKTSQGVDWNNFKQQMMAMNYSNPEKLERQLEDLEQSLSGDGNENQSILTFPADFDTLIANFEHAFISNDSAKIARLRPLMASIIAQPELDELTEKIDQVDKRADDLQDKNEELSEQIENPSMYIATKRTLKMMGLSLGWIGLYFITTIAFFKGQTLGKRLLKIRVVRLNNKPIGLFFAFERFGGYAAGFATGLLGFFQVYWDANRQAIHDKIAGTVVIDLRVSKKESTEELRKEVLDNENLLRQF